MIRLVGREGRKEEEAEKKREEKRREGLLVYRYRDGDLLSCIPLLAVQPVLRGESDAPCTLGRRKKKETINFLLTYAGQAGDYLAADFLSIVRDR